jgi:hypothetical protein
MEIIKLFFRFIFKIQFIFFFNLTTFLYIWELYFSNKVRYGET